MCIRDSDTLFCAAAIAFVNHWFSVSQIKKAGTPCFHSVPAFVVFGFSVPTTPTAYSILTPHRFVRLLFGKTSQNWCSCGVLPQMPFEIHSKFHRICVLILHFTAQSASSWGCGKNWLCYRPSDSNNVHEVNPLFNEPSNKLQQRPRKLCTVLVTALFWRSLTETAITAVVLC